MIANVTKWIRQTSALHRDADPYGLSFGRLRSLSPISASGTTQLCAVHRENQAVRSLMAQGRSPPLTVEATTSISKRTYRNLMRRRNAPLSFNSQEKQRGSDAPSHYRHLVITDADEVRQPRHLYCRCARLRGGRLSEKLDPVTTSYPARHMRREFQWCYFRFRHAAQFRSGTPDISSVHPARPSRISRPPGGHERPKRSCFFSRRSSYVRT